MKKMCEYLKFDSNKQERSDCHSFEMYRNVECPAALGPWTLPLFIQLRVFR